MKSICICCTPSRLLEAGCRSVFLARVLRYQEEGYLVTAYMLPKTIVESSKTENNETERYQS